MYKIVLREREGTIVGGTAISHGDREGNRRSRADLETMSKRGLDMADTIQE